jgi:cell wall-associated NlpC family hydrolase
LKKIALLSFLFLFLVSCKSSHSGIITSKEEALEKGIYKAPKAKKSVAKTSNAKDATTEKKKKEKIAKTKEPKAIVVKKDDEQSVFISQLIETAMEYNGVRYQYGGNTFAGIDCSGLVCTVYKTHDISLPRTSNALSKTGKKIKRKKVKKGDLIFFKTSRRNTINHVGIVTDVVGDEIFFIHASTSSGVVVSSLKEAYYKKAFAQFNRVLDVEYF